MQPVASGQAETDTETSAEGENCSFREIETASNTFWSMEHTISSNFLTKSRTLLTKHGPRLSP